MVPNRPQLQSGRRKPQQRLLDRLFSRSDKNVLMPTVRETFKMADENPDLYYRAGNFDRENIFTQRSIDGMQTQLYRHDPDIKLTPDAFIDKEQDVIRRGGIYVSPTIEGVSDYIDTIQGGGFSFGGKDLQIIKGTELDTHLYHGRQAERLITPEKVVYSFPDARANKEYYGDFTDKFLNSRADFIPSERTTQTQRTTNTLPCDCTPKR